jgi:hypothetical protein
VGAEGGERRAENDSVNRPDGAGALRSRGGNGGSRVQRLGWKNRADERIESRG